MLPDALDTEHWQCAASRQQVACQLTLAVHMLKVCIFAASQQGLDLDAAGGVAAPGTWLSRDEEVRRQRQWAEQTDTRLAGVAEQMTIARDNVAHTAGARFVHICSPVLRKQASGRCKQQGCERQAAMSKCLSHCNKKPTAQLWRCSCLLSSLSCSFSTVKAGKFLKKLHNRITARVEGEPAASSASSFQHAERPQLGEVP